MRLHLGTLESIYAYMARIVADGSTFDVRVGKPTTKRSVEQNAALHGLIRSIANFTGNSVDEIKDYVCETYLGQVTYEFNGEERTRARRTSELSTAECADLISQVQALAAELGVAHELHE